MKEGIQMDNANTNSNYAPVATIDFSSYDRVIAISDIHGDYIGFHGILNKLHFSDKDALVIVGDILEKGSHSLELLQEVMSLSEHGNIYTIAGNNDVIFKEWYSDEVTDEDVQWYMNSRENSILIEMANQLNIPFETLDDIANLKTAIQKHYSKEIAYLQKIPYIIDSNIATFVHAGIEPGDLYTQDKEYCLTAKSFGDKILAHKDFPNQIYRFEKPLIVGHWPISNYNETIIDINPYYNANTNVYSIDGGNSMKKWQQINYLIFKKDGTITNGYYDSLPKVKVLEAQSPTNSPITLTFPNTELEIRERLEEKSRCYIPYLDMEMVISNASIYTYKYKQYCSDFTTYHLPVEAGEIVSYCGETNDGILIKRNGIVGKYHGKYRIC